ncbi:MAG TPA: hypothetical protein VFE53_05650 [Mucilaginibacter sp.]|jgi:hypothetical protein|nr:hypothetical protein [Mucilaginibacter sp.]
MIFFLTQNFLEKIPVRQKRWLLISAFLLSFGLTPALAQRDKNFYKIQASISKTSLDTDVFKTIDTILHTESIRDGHIKVIFNRDVDFGYRHKRIQIKLRSFDYQVNLLTKNDSVCLSSTTLASSLGVYEDDFRFNQSHSIAAIDSQKALKYLNLRNEFYRSSKTLRDIKDELDSNEIYALRGGDGYTYTWSKLHIDTLVKRNDLKELEKMLQSVNCETQTYGVRGFDLLKRNKVKISSYDEKIIAYIKKRNSDLESCAGDICPIIWKAYN